jgi:hypothetical protein
MENKGNPFFYSFILNHYFNLIIIQSSHFPKLIRVYIEEAVKYRRKKTLLISTTENMPISIFDCYQLYHKLFLQLYHSRICLVNILI